MNRLEKLACKLVDGEITENEVRELETLTRPPEGRDAFLRLIEVEAHLQSAGQNSVADQVVDLLRAERRQRIEDGVMKTIAASWPDESASQRCQASSPDGQMLSYRVRVSLASAAALAMVIVFATWLRSVQQHLPTIAQLEVYDSSVVVTRTTANAKQTIIDATQTIPLKDGQTIETSRANDSAEILYADGTRIELLSKTKVTLSSTENDAKQLIVAAGRIQADVARQPEGRPLQIVTPTARLEVLGTTLGVDVEIDSTQLEVASGLVAITRNVDDQRVNVSEGHFVRATDSSKDAFAATPFPAMPEIWTEDFRDGLPPGWSGRMIEAESGMGVQAVLAQRDQQSNFSITTQNAWQRGEHALFQVHDDSILNIRLRQSKFARITVMLAARAYPPEQGRFGANLFYTQKRWNEDLAAGQWKTIAIPLHAAGWHIRKRTKEGGAPDLNGLAAYLIHITTMEQDTDLTVDRMWVTRGPEEQAQ